MLALIPALFAVVGVLMYALSSNAKLAEIGRIIFACSFLVLMASAATKVVRLF